MQQAIDNAQALGDVAEQATLTSNLATVKGNLGQVPDALALAQRSLALQAQLGATGGPEGAVVETYAALYCGMVGRYGKRCAGSTMPSPASCATGSRCGSRSRRTTRRSC